VITVFEPSTGGGAFMAWTETLDLFAAGPSDRAYELIPDTGEILFGDGITGMIPPPDDGSQPGGNVVATSYQFGGGLSGNVGATSLTKVLGNTGTVSFDANNALPAAGGDDEEAVASGVARAPAVVRSRFRAVSLADFEALALETPTTRVARAKALANTRPHHVPGSTPGSVTMILVPNAPFASSIFTAILLPDAVAEAVRAYLDQRRLVTAELHTMGAVFRKVTVTASLQLAAGTGAAATLAAALGALQTYFHALVGGDDGTGWPFGGTIFFSRVFQRLLDVPGVSLVESVSIALDTAAGVSCQDVALNQGELLFSGQHQIVVTVAP
jgi:predicted phage baseplate assembly protein